ncbi:hypothetical protein CJ030_MR2G010239 [Morella rubra]|uniref:Glycolipid transfer protein domain-containing protein n=1 Tax=Morella rubra TaxID=262757 RepID=A0A6A1WBI8_9ROSI|nr:hypothetical protein CJ030_MR2G010239 [Morella rubra]
MANLVHGKPLRNISEAFKELAATVDSQTAEAFKELAATVDSRTADVEVTPFSRACSLLSPLIGSLGIAFKFTEMDYTNRSVLETIDCTFYDECSVMDCIALW